MSEIIDVDEQEFSLNERMYLGITKMNKIAGYGGFFLFISAVLVVFTGPKELSLEMIVPAIIFALAIVYIVWLAFRIKDLGNVLNEYIRQNYFLSLQTVRPEGKNSLEKFMSLAQNVFPTIKKELEKSPSGKLSWEDTRDKLDGKYKFDISLDTSNGKFLLKYFPDGVKFDDVKQLVEIAKKYYRDKDVLRFVVVSPEYEELFYSDELNEKMESLIPSKPIEFKTLLSKGQTLKWIQLDLILERENGYTTIWID